MEDLWTIDDPEAADVRYEALMEGIRWSDPLAVMAAVEGMDGSCTYVASHPNVNWTLQQMQDLAKAIVAQIDILAAHARTPDITAYRALEMAEGCQVLRETEPAAQGRIRALLEAMADPLEVRIRDLFTMAKAGDNAALKAAIDLIMSNEAAELADIAMLAGFLPPDMTVSELRVVLDRYREEAVDQGLPPLAEPFGR